MTKYREVYDYFLSLIDDPYYFLEREDSDELMYRYLLNSIPKFRRCKQDLKDRNTEGFNVDLTDFEILILGNLMLVEYYNPKINTIELIKQALSWKDFSMSSQANHLNALLALKNSKQSEINQYIISYGYENTDLSLLQ